MVGGSKVVAVASEDLGLARHRRIREPRATDFDGHRESSEVGGDEREEQGAHEVVLACGAEETSIRDQAGVERADADTAWLGVGVGLSLELGLGLGLGLRLLLGLGLGLGLV